MSGTKPEETVISLELTNWNRKDCDFLKQHTGITSDRELIDNALTIFRWALEQISQRRDIGSFDSERKTYRVLQMAALQYTAKTRLAA
jgi:hypothetical protein